MEKLKKFKRESDFYQDKDYNYINYAELDDIVKCYCYLLSKDFSLDDKWTSNGIWKIAFAHYYRID